MSSKRVVFLQIPRMDPEPQFGLMLMEDSLKKAGHVPIVYDANLDLYNQYDLESLDWDELERWGIQQLNYKDLLPSIHNKILDIIDNWGKHVASLDPDFIGVSVFSHESRNWSRLVCYALRKYNKAPIIVGGRGLSDPGVGAAQFADELISWDLADFFINGEAEKEIVNIVEGKSKKIGTREFFIEDDLDRYDISFIDPARFSHYKIKSTKYHVKNFQHIGTVDEDPREPMNKTFATRGCVKRCTFCDVPLTRPKFSMRTPSNLVEEIKEGYYRYGILRTWFGDDMINGSYKHMMSWLEPLAKWMLDEKLENSRLRWVGQFGIKSRKTTPEELFELMGITNAEPNIGIDHFSDSVLTHMKKHYTHEDIFWYYENFLKHNVTVPITLVMSSYPSETLEDFQIQLDRLTEFSKFIPIMDGLELLTSCTLSVGSELESLPGMHVYSSPADWFWEGNPELTKEERIRRRMAIEDHIVALGYTSRKQQVNWLRFLRAQGVDDEY
jgi:hypothetical protein